MKTTFITKTGTKRKSQVLAKERHEIIQKLKKLEENEEVKQVREKSLKNPYFKIENSTMMNGDKDFLYKKLVHNLTKITVNLSDSKDNVVFQCYYDEDEQNTMGPCLSISLDQFLISGRAAFMMKFALQQNGHKLNDDMEELLWDMLNPTDNLIAHQLKFITHSALDLFQEIVLYKDSLTSMQDLLESYNTLVAALQAISWKSLQNQIEKMALERIHYQNHFRIEDTELLTHIVFTLRCMDLLDEAYKQLLAAEEILSNNMYIVRMSRVFHEIMFNNMYTFDRNYFPKPEIVGNYRAYNVFRSLLHGYGYTTKFLVKRVVFLAQNMCGWYFKEYFEKHDHVLIEKELYTYVSIPDQAFQMCALNISNLCTLIYSCLVDEHRIPLKIEKIKPQELPCIQIKTGVDEMEASKISHGTMLDEPVSLFY